MSIPRDSNERRPPVHPGEMLREEFMVPLGTTNEELAAALGIPLEDVLNLVEERSGIDDAMARRLSKHYRMSEGFWTGLQDHYEQEVAEDARDLQIPLTK